jgi:hypothetical protein
VLDYHKTMGLGRKLLDKHGLIDWKFDVVNLRNASMFGPRCEGYMGCCDDPTRTIYIDWHASQRTVRQTILHEIAHALTPGDDHGKAWLKTASNLGCTFVHLLPYYREENNK